MTCAARRYESRPSPIQLAEQHTQKDSSANASGEVGVSLGSTTGIYVSAAGGLSRAHGNGETHTDSIVTASDTLTLISGNDTTIQGAQAKGNTVLASIGGNLNIASEQDTSDYASKNAQGGITLVYGFSSSGSGSGVGVNGNLAYGQMDSDYASVTQVSGIAAGSGGYQLHVGGNTDLKGAVLASTADPSLNLLDAGSLSFSDLENQASYSAMSGGISVSSGRGGTSASPSIGVPQFGDTSSTTRAGIAQGTIITRDEPATDLSGLDRTPDIDAAGLKPIFDPQKVAEQQELGNVAGQVGMRAAGDIASYEANHATTEEEQKSWQDGGANKVLLHGLVGAATAALGGGSGLQGALGAAASERASGAMQDYLVQHGILPNDPKFKTLMQLGSVAVGAVAGGGAGAATALQGEQFNRQLHETEKARIKALAGGDPQKEADLSAAACALVHCSAEYAKDSPEYAYYSQLEVLGGQPQYADERTLLQQQSITRDVVIPSGMSVPVTENLFDYTYGDKTSDTLTYINNSYGHPFTRVGGGLQAVGGIGATVTGGAAVATGAAGCPETLGGGCALAAGGVLLTGWGLDQTQAGGRTAWNGTSTQTFGGQAIQQAFGISPQAAELMYGALGAAGTLGASNALLAARGAPLLSGATETGGVLPSLDTKVLTVGQARNLGGANRGLIYVQETPAGGQAAQDFQAGTSGAFSDIASQKSAVPALRYDNPNTNGYNYVKFDGIEQGADGGQVLLIDAKTKLAIWSDSTRQSVSDTLLRVDAALKQNPGYKVVYEFPNQKVAQQAQQFIERSRYANTVTVRVRGQ